ncbi:hypothetical protein lbkm_1626 [Lachnospiraceae bacterium KM106-2]|nr:hypothetical protein lbkm_1626 [Lachnospiraceae bacterium KM106-2]
MLLLLAGSFGIMIYLKLGEMYGSGSDMWGHLFKSNLMYESIRKGDYYPLYTKEWYNGVQPYRYWAPFPYYVMAGLQAICKGNLINAYYLFAGVSYFVGGYAFLLWGKATRRMKTCGVIGLLWFFFPENIRVFFCEGNLPRMVTTILIPYLVYNLYRYVRLRRKLAMIGIMIFMSLMVFSHVMIAAMMGIGAFIFLLFDSMSNHSYRRSIEAIIGMLIAIIMCGIWLVPSLVGGLVGMDSSASESVMSSLTYSLMSSLNPMNRIDGITDTFYYGISFLVIAILGLLLGKQRRKAGYVLTLIILLCTTPEMVPILSKLPLSQLLWMMRFATIGYAFLLLSFAEWEKLRPSFCGFLLLLLIIDCAPSLNLKRYYTPTHHNTKEEISSLRDMTEQRTAIMDLSQFGSYPSFGLFEEGNTSYTYGWAWQGASTAKQIVNLNTAIEQEAYWYVFDRAVELGNDTVLIKKDLVGKKNESLMDLVEAANASGYKLKKETNLAYLFKKETPSSFGVVTNYEGIGIGSHAEQIALTFPVFTAGSSEYIDDYTKAELTSYRCIYLSGFSYHDKKKAEELIEEVAAQGTRVIIDMGHIPVNAKTNRYELLGVTAQDIQFKDQYPNMEYKDTKFSTASFDKEYEAWNTVFLQGTDQVLGKVEFLGRELPYLGSNEDNSIYFMGFNLYYHYTLTKDESVLPIFTELFQTKGNELPRRKIVPIDVDYGNDSITITSDFDHVNTTLAYQDIFKSEQKIANSNQLLMVNKGTTVLTYSYPYRKVGILISIFGCGLFFTLLFTIRRKGG